MRSARPGGEEGLELGDGSEAPRAGSAAREDVVARDHGLRDGRLQLAEGAELELAAVDGADQPALGRARAGCGRRTLNWCPQFVHLTVVPRSETRASSNSYAVLQRSQVTSIGLALPQRAGASWER